MELIEIAAEIEALGDTNTPRAEEINNIIHDMQPEPKVIRPLRYLTSIDAAMTLVPEGYALGFKRAPCQRSHAMLATIGYEANASGATPALALCAAALRAKEQPNEG